MVELKRIGMTRPGRRFALWIGVFVFAAVWLGACASGTPSSGDTGSTGSLTITPPTLPTGVVNVNYTSPAFTASGGSGSGYTFALATGSISPLSLGASTGVISGAPTTAETLQFTVKVTDSLGNTATTGQLSITVNQVLAITPPVMPTGVVNVNYTSPAFTASGGSGTGYSFAVATGSLSPLTIGSSTGIITGTPTTATTLQFTVKVTDSQGDTATSNALNITIYPTLAITPPTLPAGVVNASYTSPAFTASGGSGTGYTFSVVSGSLAPLSIGSSTGIITGAPTTSGTLQFTIKVTDSVGNTVTSSQLSITVNGPLAITPPTLATGVVNVSYTSPAFNASGGSGTGYTFAVASGSLSPLTIGSSTGVISGTPTTTGTLQFAIKVTDSQGNTATTTTLSITVNPALTITPPTLPTGLVNVSYTSPAFTASGGSGSGYTFAVATGSLSPLSIGSSTGIITGIPTIAGTLQFTIKVTDSVGNTASTSQLSITVNGPMAITPPPLPPGLVNVGYTSPAFIAVGGSGTGFTFTVASGSLSPLTIGSSTGVISGTPTATGSLQFAIKVTDSLGDTATTGTLSITIYPTLAITPPTLPVGVVNVSYTSLAFTANGGSGTGYTFAVATGSILPLSLGSSTGVISGTPTTAGTLQFTVKVTDSLGDTATTGQLSVTVNQVLAITPPTLPIGVVNATYNSSAFTASGGSGSGYTFAVATGSILPLSLGSSTGVISGTPTTAGTLQFTVKVTDSLGNTATTGQLSITVNQALAITPPTLPIGVVNASYTSPAFTASGGSGSGYTFAVATGILSPLSIDSSTGIITGTPTTAGTLQFTIMVTDSLGLSASTGNLSIMVNPALTISLVQHVSGSSTRNSVMLSPYCYYYQLPGLTTAGNSVVVGFTYQNNVTPMVTDDIGNSYTIEEAYFDAADSQSVGIAAAFNIAAGARVISLCFNSDPGAFVQPMATEFDNVTGIDGAGSATNGNGTAASPGSMTATVSGDLVYQVAVSLSFNQSSFTASSQSGVSWNLLSADLMEGLAGQYGVDSSTGAINPTISMGTSQNWVSAGILLKPGNSGSVPSGLRIVHLVHENVAYHTDAGGTGNSFPNPLALNFPSSGNLLVAMIGGGNTSETVTGMTDTNRNTWTQAGSPVVTGDNDTVQAYYSGSATSSSDLGLTLNWTDGLGDFTIFLYDVTGAASSPFDSTAGAFDFQGTTGSVTMPFTITPAVSNEIIFSQVIWDFNTGTGLNGQLFDTNTFSGESVSGPESVDENNGWGHVITTSTDPVSFVWTVLSDNLPVGNWAGNAVAFTAGN